MRQDSICALISSTVGMIYNTDLSHPPQEYRNSDHHNSVSTSPSALYTNGGQIAVGNEQFEVKLI